MVSSIEDGGSPAPAPPRRSPLPRARPRARLHSARLPYASRALDSASRALAIPPRARTPAAGSDFFALARPGHPVNRPPSTSSPPLAASKGSRASSPWFPPVRSPFFPRALS